MARHFWGLSVAVLLLSGCEVPAGGYYDAAPGPDVVYSSYPTTYYDPWRSPPRRWRDRRDDWDDDRPVVTPTPRTPRVGREPVLTRTEPKPPPRAVIPVTSRPNRPAPPPPVKNCEKPDRRGNPRPC